MTDMGMNEPELDTHALRAEFQRLREELATIRELLTASGAEILSDSKAAAEKRIAALQAEVEKLVSDVKGQGVEVLEQIDRKARERPLTSLAIAFGVGLLAAQILRR